MIHFIELPEEKNEFYRRTRWPRVGEDIQIILDTEVAKDFSLKYGACSEKSM